VSHCAQQIRDWFVTSLTGVSGLPTPWEGYPRQIAPATSACIVTSAAETIQRQTMDTQPIDARQLTVLVVLVAASIDGGDALCLLAEEALAGAASFPGKTFELIEREYQENVETDRGYVSVTITYNAIYYVARNDVETFK
jgi:hypothetical protein